MNALSTIILSSWVLCIAAGCAHISTENQSVRFKEPFSSEKQQISNDGQPSLMETTLVKPLKGVFVSANLRPAFIVIIMDADGNSLSINCTGDAGLTNYGNIRFVRTSKGPGIKTKETMFPVESNEAKDCLVFLKHLQYQIKLGSIPVNNGDSTDLPFSIRVLESLIKEFSETPGHDIKK